MPRRILLIDDDPTIRALVSASLGATSDWTIATAPSGPDGIESARAQVPDAILLDLMMPDMDGTATLKHLRSQSTTARVPVIILTASAGSDAVNEHRLSTLSVTGVIRKPFDIMGLADHLKLVLGWDR